MLLIGENTETKYLLQENGEIMKMENKSLLLGNWENILGEITACFNRRYLILDYDPAKSIEKSILKDEKEFNDVWNKLDRLGFIENETVEIFRSKLTRSEYLKSISIYHDSFLMRENLFHVENVHPKIREMILALNFSKYSEIIPFIQIKYEIRTVGISINTNPITFINHLGRRIFFSETISEEFYLIHLKKNGVKEDNKECIIL